MKLTQKDILLINFLNKHRYCDAETAGMIYETGRYVYERLAVLEKNKFVRRFNINISKNLLALGSAGKNFSGNKKRVDGLRVGQGGLTHHEKISKVGIALLKMGIDYEIDLNLMHAGYKLIPDILLKDYAVGLEIELEKKSDKAYRKKLANIQTDGLINKTVYIIKNPGMFRERMKKIKELPFKAGRTIDDRIIRNTTLGKIGYFDIGEFYRDLEKSITRIMTETYPDEKEGYLY